MKRVKKILIITILIGMSTVVAVSNPIQSYIVDYDIMYNGSLSDRLNYPLISYNDNTYMAVRDVASLWNKDISWNEENKIISFKSLTPEENIIQEPETALAIGKAIISEYYKDRVNENSVFHVANASPDALWADDLWWVSVIFNPEEEITDEEYILLNADARIEINPSTCNFSLIEALPEGGFKTIVDFKTW